MDETGGCGPLYATYCAARSDDVDAMQSAWADGASDATPDGLDVDETVEDVADAVEAGDTDAVATLIADRVFAGESADRIDGPLARILGTVLWAFGYVAAFVLFFRAHSPDAVVARLRWAYGVVGVNIRDTESVDGVERTTFRCPYRNVGADRWGRRRVCHDVLDRVDDGYVTFLDRHRNLDYDRPRPCAGGPCCYSEVTDR